MIPQKATIFAVLMYSLYSHPRYFKFKWKYQQCKPCFQTIFLFLMTMIKVRLLRLDLVITFNSKFCVTSQKHCCLHLNAVECYWEIFWITILHRVSTSCKYIVHGKKSISSFLHSHIFLSSKPLSIIHLLQGFIFQVDFYQWVLYLDSCFIFFFWCLVT